MGYKAKKIPGRKILGSSLLLLPLFYIAISSFSRSGRQQELSILSYNVQNLFDCVDNGGEYPAYQSTNPLWNRAALHKKLTNIAMVIKESVPGAPDLVALQEVENQAVLDLLNREYLWSAGYKYRVIASEGYSAVSVALLSRYPLKAVALHGIYMEGQGATRAILELELSIKGRVLVLFNNHWKSKRGGREKTEPPRLFAAKILKKRIESLRESDLQKDIVAVGDLNENFDEFWATGGQYPTALLPLDSASGKEAHNSSLLITGLAPALGREAILFSPWPGWRKNQPVKGSYVFNGQWETPDHMLLSAGLFDSQGFWFHAFSVVHREFMLDGQGFPWAWDYRKGSGYSDHLPLLLILRFSQK